MGGARCINQFICYSFGNFIKYTCKHTDLVYRLSRVAGLMCNNASVMGFCFWSFMQGCNIPGVSIGCVCVFFSAFLLCCDLSSCLCLVPLPPLSQEGDDYEVVPNSKFYVSRTANRDNSSAYYINGKKATFKDVGILLRSHGIDLDHNRFLILQVIDFFVIFACSTFVFVLILPSPPARCQIVCCSGFLCLSENPISPQWV